MAINKTKFLLACFLTGIYSCWHGQSAAVNLNGYLPPSRINGNFLLTDQTGQRFSSEQLAGKYTLLLFGYTQCADICPVTLHNALQVKEALAGELPLQIVLITLDPERDTPEKLGQYVAAFDQEIIALSGNASAIADIAQRYRVKYRKVPSKRPGEYNIDHSAFLYLLDTKASPLVLYPYATTPDIVIGDLKLLIQHGQGVVTGRMFSRPGMMDH